MEPKILIIGRSQAVLDILIEELQRNGRNIIGAASKEKAPTLVEENQIDFVVMSADLDNQVQEQMKNFILSLHPDMPVHFMERTPQSSPADTIPFVNQKAVEFKIERAIGKHPLHNHE